MIPGTTGWLIRALSKLPEDMRIMISISGTYFPLSGKVDLVTAEFSMKDNPTKLLGEEFVCIFPEDDRPTTPDLTKGIPQN